MEKYETKDTDLQAGGFEEGVEAQDNATSVEPDDMVCTQCVKGADDLRNAPPICCPRAIILPRSTMYLQNRLKRRHAAMACVCS